MPTATSEPLHSSNRARAQKCLVGDERSRKVCVWCVQLYGTVISVITKSDGRADSVTDLVSSTAMTENKCVLAVSVVQKGGFLPLRPLLQGRSRAFLPFSIVKDVQKGNMHLETGLTGCAA